MNKEQMTPRERVMCALNRGQGDRVPWIENYIHLGMVKQLLGREVDVIPGVRIAPEVHEKLCIDNISYDFRPPIYAETEQRGDLIHIKKPWLHTWEDLEKLKTWLPDPNDAAFYENAKEYLHRYKGNYAAVCSLRIGISNVYNSMGYENFLYRLYDEPEFVEEAFRVYGDWCVKVIENINEMGFDLAWINEDIAFSNGPMVSADFYEKYIFPHAKRVISYIGLPKIYHSDGNYESFFRYVLQYGPKGLANIEPPCMDIFSIKEKYGNQACIVGNIDLHYTLTQGTPEETAAEVKEKLERVGKGGGYIIASSNGITSYCKPENVLSMNDTILRHGWYL